jgi:hypothetical protein
MSFPDRAAVLADLIGRDDVLLADYSSYHDYTSGDVRKIDIYMLLESGADFHGIAARYPTITEYSVRSITLGFEKHSLTAQADWAAPKCVYGDGVLYDEKLDVFRLLKSDSQNPKLEPQILRPKDVAIIRKSGLCFAAPTTTACFPFPHIAYPNSHDLSQKRGDAIFEKDELAALAAGECFPIRPAIGRFVGLKPSFDNDR